MIPEVQHFMSLWKGKESDLSWKKELEGEQGCGIVSMKVRICSCLTLTAWIKKEKGKKKRHFSVLSTYWHVPPALFGNERWQFSFPITDTVFLLFIFLLLDSLCKWEGFVLVSFLDRKVCIFQLSNWLLRTSFLSCPVRHIYREPGPKFWAALPWIKVPCGLQKLKPDLRWLGWEKKPGNLIDCWEMKETEKTISHVVHDLNEKHRSWKNKLACQSQRYGVFLTHPIENYQEHLHSWGEKWVCCLFK